MTVLRVDTIAGIGSTQFGTTLDGNVRFNSQNFVVLPKGTSTQYGVLRETTDVIGAGGTFYDNLVLAMPFNQATGLRDVSSRNRNPGYGGTTNNVGIATSTSKYYGSSVRFDGTGDFLQFTGIGSDFVFDNQFTIEFWIRLNSILKPGAIHPSPISFIKSDGTNGGQVYLNADSSFLSLWDGSSNIVTTGNSSVTTGNWYHVAVTRDGSNSCRIFLDGTLKNTASSTFVFGNTPGNLRIGTYNVDAAANTIDGYLQDLRIYKGVAKYTANFTPPDRIAEVGVGFTTGSLRYNTDSNRVELYDGNQWAQLQMSQVGLGTGGDTGPGARGVFGGGSPTTGGNVIDYVNISSTGNAIDFGDLDDNIKYVNAFSSSTRGVFGGGETPAGNRNQIRYITISSTGDSLSFGTLTTATTYIGALSNSTRGIFAGGKAPGFTNTIQYVTIASTGNGVSFGQLSQARSNIMSTASPTRGLFAGGYTPGYQNTIDYITISTLGNATSFGNLTLARNGSNAAASPTRALFFCADVSPYTTIDYVTISTLGNAMNFGSATSIKGYAAATSNCIRGIAGGGQSPTNTNAIEYVNISTQGNSVSFGQLTTNQHLSGGACSNAHGGL